MVTPTLNRDSESRKFPKSVRLLKQFEFDQVYNSEVFAADGTLVIKAITNGTDRTRLGMSVSRKVGNAVVRNRWKRRIRESFRRQYSHLPIGLDLVVRPRKGAVCQYDNISRSLIALTKKIGRRLQNKIT